MARHAPETLSRARVGARGRSRAARARSPAFLARSYIVLTSVDRDDLPDGGAAHFAQTVELLRSLLQHGLLEVASEQELQAMRAGATGTIESVEA